MEKKCGYVGCGKTFFTRVGNQRYCCPECQLKAKKLRDSALYETQKAMKKEKPERKLCKRKDKCVYGELAGGTWVCSYLLIEGKPRGCSGNDCIHFKRKGAKSGSTKIKETKETC